MNIAYIRQLMNWMTDAQLTRLELVLPTGSLRLCRPATVLSHSHTRSQSQTPLVTTDTENDAIYVTAPSVGEFQITHGLHTAPSVKEGAFVEKEALVGYLKVGLLYQPVYAPCAGIISAPLSAIGQQVGYGAPLFSIHTSS